MYSSRRDLGRGCLERHLEVAGEDGDEQRRGRVAAEVPGLRMGDERGDGELRCAADVDDLWAVPGTQDGTRSVKVDGRTKCTTPLPASNAASERAGSCEGIG